MAHRRRRVAIAGLGLAAVAAGVIVGPQQAIADSGTSLYVNNASADCSDAGTGTQAVPYCTIQAAADAAVAGNTVLIADSGNAYPAFTVSTSGTADAPITFEPSGAQFSVSSTSKVSGSYISISGGDFGDFAATAMTVTGSHVTLNDDRFAGDASPLLETGTGVDGLTVERSIFNAVSNTSLITLGSGDADTVLTTNILATGTADINIVGSAGQAHTTAATSTSTDYPAVVVSSDSNTDVTSNTIVSQCFTGVSVAKSTDTSIENNIVSADECESSGKHDVAVDASSAASTTEDYNLLSMDSGGVTAYDWAGTTYSTQSAFATASGQGENDLVDTGVAVDGGIDASASGSASAAAPGELTSDLYGSAWPQASPDRGAVADEEYNADDASLITANFSSQQVGISLDLHGMSFGSSQTMTVDWGDGSKADDQMFGRGQPWIDYANNADDHMYAQRGTYTVTVTFTDADQTITRTATVSTDGSTYVPVSPTRVLDTRKGTGAPEALIGPHGTIAVDVTDAAPANIGEITAVVVNVTATDETGNGVITAYPDGTTLPTASNLNFSAHENVPNLVTVKVGADGKVDFNNGSAASTDLIADVEGYYVASSTGSYYLPNSPKRILDTRKGTGAALGAVAAGGTISVSAPTCTSGSDSATATAVAVNVTAVSPTANGLVTVYPDGTSLPNASNLNYAMNENVPNLVVVEVGADGKFDLHNTSSGTVQLVADLEGCYSTTLGDAFVPVKPYRALDTRNATGQLVTNEGPALPDETAYWYSVEENPAGSNNPIAPAAAVMNVTVTQPTANGVITAYPQGSNLPTASNLNFTKGETVPNLVMVPSPDFEILLYNDSAGTTQLIVDIDGYFS